MSVALLLGLAVLAGSAFAAVPRLHLALSKAEPGVNSTVHVSPPSVVLHFNQQPQARMTGIRVTGAAGEVKLGPVEADAADGRVLRARFASPLSPGSYEVAWRAMAADGHVVNGTYRFTYQPGS